MTKCRFKSLVMSHIVCEFEQISLRNDKLWLIIKFFCATTKTATTTTTTTK